LEDGKDSDDDEDEDIHPSSVEYQKLGSLDYLAWCEKLQIVTLSSINDCYDNEFTRRIPILKNPRSLVLLGLDRSSCEGNVDDIVGVLLPPPRPLL
jgi:hypothetical protein